MNPERLSSGVCVFFFSLDDGNRALPHPKGKLKTFLYPCLPQLNALCRQEGVRSGTWGAEPELYL